MPCAQHLCGKDEHEVRIVCKTHLFCTVAPGVNGSRGALFFRWPVHSIASAFWIHTVPQEKKDKVYDSEVELKYEPWTNGTVFREDIRACMGLRVGKVLDCWFAATEGQAKTQRHRDGTI